MISVYVVIPFASIVAQSGLNEITRLTSFPLSLYFHGTLLHILDISGIFIVREVIDPLLKDLFATALAEEILNYVDFVNKEALIERVNHNAIVNAYRDAGIFTDRHQEVD